MDLSWIKLSLVMIYENEDGFNAGFSEENGRSPTILLAAKPLPIRQKHHP